MYIVWPKVPIGGRVTDLQVCCIDVFQIILAELSTYGMAKKRRKGRIVMDGMGYTFHILSQCSVFQFPLI